MSLGESAKWYLLAGKTGAGKSTAARRITATKSAVVFAIDEWMNTLFWPDSPAKGDYPWAIERVLRCEEQITRVAISLAGIGVSAVLDLGFSERAQRQRWIERATAASIPVVIHVVEAPADVCWQRVCERNRGSSSTYTFEVTREMFDFTETLWEPVTADERRLTVDIGAESADTA